MLEKISHQHELRTWAGLKAAKALTLVLLPAYVLSMYRNLIVELNLVTAAYYTALVLFLAAMGWFQKVRPNLRLAAVSMVILLIALGVLFRNQDLGFAQTFGVLGASVLPLYFNRRIAPYLSMLPILGLGGLAFLATDAPTLIIIIITSGSLAVVYVVTSTFCYVIGHTEEQRDVAENALNLSLEKERLLDLSYSVMDLAVAELDLETDRIKLIAGESPNKALFAEGADYWDFYTGVYGDDAAHKIRDLFNTPGQSLVLRANVNGEPDHWAKVGCTEEYQRDGKSYRSIYRIIVDELVAAKEQSEQRGAELQSLLDRQKQMYAVIGHELRTPAASLQMILDTQDEQEELNKALIQANLQQLISVIDTLRAVAQPEKSVKGIYYDVLMDELLAQQLENFEPMAQQTKVRLHEDFEGLTVHPVRIQSTLVRQVVSNLIKNALIHSGASDITLQARAELLPERKKHLLIRVLDNGSGIPQETLKTLFKPFARGATHADGTGLGLYICKDLIENMGGTLRYLDNPGGGSCFEIDLTVDLADESANDVADESASLLAGKSILLVEDNKTLQLLSEKLLTKQGARVVLANQGLEGLSHYQAGQFDLILSDIFMPEMNGYEFVSELRKRDCRLPIIGLTAATIGEETEQMLAAGADVVMSKPMNITEVSKWLANFSR